MPCVSKLLVGSLSDVRIFYPHRGTIFKKSTKIAFSLHIIGTACRMILLLVPIHCPGCVERFWYASCSCKMYRTQHMLTKSPLVAFEKILFWDEDLNIVVGRSTLFLNLGGGKMKNFTVLNLGSPIRVQTIYNGYLTCPPDPGLQSLRLGFSIYSLEKILEVSKGLVPNVNDLGLPRWG